MADSESKNFPYAVGAAMISPKADWAGEVLAFDAGVNFTAEYLASRTARGSCLPIAFEMLATTSTKASPGEPTNAAGGVRRGAWRPLSDPADGAVKRAAERSRGGKRKRRPSVKDSGAKAASLGAWPVTYRLIAMGTLMAYTAIGSQRIALAKPQELRGRGGSASSQTTRRSALPTHRFDIPKGPLGEAAKEFEKVSGVHVVIANERIRDISSPGASGVLTDEQALHRILAGTGVGYRFTAAETVTLTLAPLEQSVTVTASDDGISLSKYTQPALDTPQTITAVSQKAMQEQGVTTLRDALRNVAGISLAAGEGGSQGDNLTIRGFTARNDIFLDGARDFGSYYRDPFNLESVAVLQGPSSIMFGRGSTGGIVSQVSKTPRLDGFAAGSVEFGTDLTRRVTFDFDRPLPELGRNTACRLDVMGNDSDVAERNVTTDRRYGIAPSIEFGIKTPTRLTLSYFRQWEDDIPDYGIPWFFNQPAVVPRENYYGFARGNYLKTGDDVGTGKFEHDFSDAVTLRSQLRYANYPRDAVITEPQIDAPNTPTTVPDGIVVTRNEIAVKSVESFLDEQTDVTALFHTGPVRHTLVAGVEGGRETSDPTRFTYQNVPTTRLLDPDPNDILPATFVIQSQVHTTAYTAAAYALDTVAFGSKWELTGGIRWDRFRTNYAQSVAPASSFERVDELPSWRAAVVYKAEPNGSFYFDYGTSFNPSAESLSLSAADADTPPEKNRTFEIGTKWDLGKRRLSLGGSVFRTDKTNAREPDPGNPLLDVLDGNERVDGIEAEVSGYLTRRWELLASYAFLHSEVVSSNYYPQAVGYPLANVPQITFSIWSTYKSRWKNLEFGAGADFVDSRTASSTVPLDPATGLLKQVPGYWVANAMVRYPLSDRLDLQVNAYNLSNNYYYDEPHPEHIVPGPGRSVLASINFRFAGGSK